MVTAQEATAGPNQVELQLSGAVKISVSDGFELMTERGTFNQNESIARAPGAVTFKKGHMSGSGSNATYNQKDDVLNIAESARIVVTEDNGKNSFDGSCGERHPRPHAGRPLPRIESPRPARHAGHRRGQGHGEVVAERGCDHVPRASRQLEREGRQWAARFDEGRCHRSLLLAGWHQAGAGAAEWKGRLQHRRRRACLVASHGREACSTS